ncbi:MAG: hypothetical protein ABIC04_06445 [Nanoarchaeota archaeon]
MKITIDTKDDSHDDIKKVIKLLAHLIGEGADKPDISGDSVQDNSVQQGNVFGNLFGSSEPVLQEETTPESKEDISVEPIPSIIPY